MRVNKLKLFVVGLIVAVAVAVTGVDVSAATITDDIEIVPVGYETSFYAPSLKINKKAPKKLKKKVKVIQYSKGTQSSMYRTRAYFNTKSAYETENDYKKDNGVTALKYYPAKSGYDVIFKKAGTYKISYTDYFDDDNNNYYGSEYRTGYDDNNNYVIKKYNQSTQEYDVLSKIVEVESRYTDWYTGNEVTEYTVNGKTYKRAVEDYYAAENGSYYASDDSHIVPVKLENGADGKLHVKYSPYKTPSYTHVKQYKVVASTNILKSVKLGKSTYSSYTTGKEGGSATTTKKGKLLTGKSGKVTVTMGPNYKLTSILAKTYDENGDAIYKLVKNKGTVTYGQNYETNDKSEEGATYKYFNRSFYKETQIYAFYQNKTTKESTTVTKEGKDAAGNQTFVIEEKEMVENPKTKKKELLTTTYNVTRRKPYETATYYSYYYTKKYEYFDSQGKKQTENDTHEYNRFPISNYVKASFYLK